MDEWVWGVIWKEITLHRGRDQGQDIEDHILVKECKRKQSERKKEIQEIMMTSQEEKDQKVSRRTGRWSKSP